MVDSGHEIGIRCHHCAGPLTKNLETSEWTVAPFIRDSFSMIGSSVGGTASAFIGFNHGTACYSSFISLCWISRWHCTSTCTARFIFIQSSSPFVSATTSKRE